MGQAAGLSEHEEIVLRRPHFNALRREVRETGELLFHIQLRQRAPPAPAGIEDFLARRIEDEALLDDLLAYQSFAVKTVGVRHAEYRGRHKWKPYFEALVKNEPASLTEADVRYAVDDENVFTEWPAYARTVLWYGRRGGKYLYTAEMKELGADG